MLVQQKEKLNWLKQHHNTQDRNALSVEKKQKQDMWEKGWSWSTI